MFKYFLIYLALNLNNTNMKVYQEINLSDFNAWQGAIHIKEIILNQGKEKDFDFLIRELYPDGLSEMQLNDLLWFESEWLFESLDIEN
jgi:hypothetical protein